MNTLFEIENYKILTMWQPWASLLVHGVKKIETRPKPTTWTAEKGSYLIHAASRWTLEQASICLQEPFKSELKKLRFYIHAYAGKKKIETNLPLGQIIGAIEVTECCMIYTPNPLSIIIHPWVNPKNTKTIYIRDPELSFGNYEPGRYVWLTQNPRVLKTPIPYKGGQGYYQNFKGDINELQFL